MASLFSIDLSFGNVFVGVSGISGSTSYSNNLIGGYASTFGVSSNLVDTVALGSIALASAQTVSSSVAIGQAAGAGGRVISDSVMLGVGAGSSVSGFTSNVAIGHSSAQYQRNASNNVFLGYGAGFGTSESVPTNNVKNTAIGDGAFRFSSSNTSNVLIGTTTANYASNVSGCIVVGNDAGPMSNCSTTILIGNSSVSGFSGRSNILIGNGIAQTTTSVTNVIGIGHGLTLSGESNSIVIGTVSQTYLYANTTRNQLVLGGRTGQYSLDPSGNVVSNSISVAQVVVNGPIFNPYTLHLSFATGATIPIAPYVFIDQSSTATRLVLDTDVSAAITSNTYNFDVFIGNNTPSNIDLCGSFFPSNVPLSNTTTVVLSGNTIRKFKRLLFVNLGGNPQYYIGYLQ